MTISLAFSGTKMRRLAGQGAVPCDEHNIPTNLLGAICIPAGFMVPKGWNVVVDYYIGGAFFSMGGTMGRAV